MSTQPAPVTLSPAALMPGVSPTERPPMIPPSDWPM